MKMQIAGCTGMWLTCCAFAQSTPAAGSGIADPALPPPAAATDQAPAAAEAESPYSLTLSVDYTTGYYFRGIVQEDCGWILQPAAAFDVRVYNQDDLSINVGALVWNSIHGQKTASQMGGDFASYWYESDLGASVTITKGKFSVGVGYVYYIAPNDGWETIQELDFTLSYDDSDLLGKFALNPRMLVGIETGSGTADGVDSDPGRYLELGIAPGFEVGETTPISISFPVTLGLSLSDYYQNAAGDDDTFGYVQAGAKAEIPISCLGSGCGDWTLTAGIYGLFLGDNTKEINSDDGEELIATLGVAVSF